MGGVDGPVRGALIVDVRRVFTQRDGKDGGVKYDD